MDNFTLISTIVGIIVGVNTIAIIITRAIINGKIPEPVKKEIDRVKEKIKDTDKRFISFQNQITESIHKELESFQKIMESSAKIIATTIATSIVNQDRPLDRENEKRLTKLEDAITNISAKLVNVESTQQCIKRIETQLTEIKEGIGK